MSTTAQPDFDPSAASPGDDALDAIKRLVGRIATEIDALKQEREADQTRLARRSLGEAYAKARIGRRGLDPGDAPL